MPNRLRKTASIRLTLSASSRGLAALALAALTSTSAASAQSDLFTRLEDAGSQPNVHAGVLRLELLLEERRDVLGVELPGGGSLALVRESSESAWGDGRIWSGRVQHDPQGSAVFSILGDVAAGSIRADGKLYAVEYDGAGLHRIRAVDESAMAPCGNEASHVIAAPTATTSGPATTPGAPGFAALATGGAPPTIDVLVLYTPQARSAEGGVAAIEAKVNLAIAETNQAYANSQVVQRLRLVHQSEAAGYVEDPSFSTMLGNLRSTSDGVLDYVHALRDQYGADMVAMIVAGTQYCGIGYLMTNPSVGFAGNAFSVTSRNCATGYYSFGHELGHNMGCHHDRDNASSGAYPYSYGYRTQNGSWRTVMAYAPGTRIQYFSNPNVSYSGQALGVADPASDSAENWKSLNNTGPVVAQFRCAVPVAYGVGKMASNGATPVVSHVGSVSIAAANLSIRISQALPDKAAIAFYGFAQGSSPWNGGTLYVSGQLKRLGVRQLDASGAANFAFPIALCSAGDVVYCQGWFRDPAAADGTTVGLTNGLRVDLCP